MAFLTEHFAWLLWNTLPVRFGVLCLSVFVCIFYCQILFALQRIGKGLRFKGWTKHFCVFLIKKINFDPDSLLKELTIRRRKQINVFDVCVSMFTYYQK